MCWPSTSSSRRARRSASIARRQHASRWAGPSPSATGSHRQPSVDAAVRLRGLEHIVPPHIVVAVLGSVLKIDAVQKYAVALDPVVERVDLDAGVGVAVDGVVMDVVAIGGDDEGDAICPPRRRSG
jgi:hypothetical protein